MLAGQLPPSATWAGAGIGRFQFPVNSMSIAMGGHVRVGLEDNLLFDAEKRLPATNLALVERLAKLAIAVERSVATPAEARRIIGLPEH
jgi:3-keto-5-aminohexanoate cleavage enzyme